MTGVALSSVGSGARQGRMTARREEKRRARARARGRGGGGVAEVCQLVTFNGFVLI